MLGQAHAPRGRLLGISAAVAFALVVPAVSGAERTPSLTRLQGEHAALEAKSRSAVLGLYAVDSQLASARARLDALQAHAGRLRGQRSALMRELRIAQVGMRVSRQRLASRLRVLYAHGSTSTLEVLFGARSLEQALTELDALDRVTAINRDVLTQLRSAQARIGRTSRALAAREAALAEATRKQVATTRSLENARAERAAYVGDLRRRLDLNARQIDSVEAQAQAATDHARELTAASSSVSAAAPAVPVSTRTGGTITVVATGYSIHGRTSTGLPTGWGVAAVDPRVIPMGTHIEIPGYGTAVAADTGGSVVGATIDLWFPSPAQAAAWGRRSITIRVH